jgi:hypothetical protein
MKRVHRTTCLVIAALVLNLFVSPCFAAGGPPAGPEKNITVNDPQFIPLSEAKSMREGLKWYWYLIGAAVIGGGIAAAASGNKSSTSSPPAPGAVTGTW